MKIEQSDTITPYDVECFAKRGACYPLISWLWDGPRTYADLKAQSVAWYGWVMAEIESIELRMKGIQS